jgi:hypothetical protein
MSYHSPRKVFVGLALSTGLGACAIHPLPEDVTGVKTAQIVHRIRCEVLEAVETAENNITTEKSEKPWRAAQKQTRLNILKSVGIVLSFSLNGEEMNNINSASATFQQTLHHGTFSLNPNASSMGDTLDRQNIRTFTVVDNFGQMIKNYPNPAKACARQPTGSNYVYPITGNIGVAEMIDTFVNLAIYANLGAEQQNLKDGTGTPTLALNSAPTLVDTIAFTTVLSAGVTPMWTLTPVGKALQLTNASINLGVSRKDIHEVIVALALPGSASSSGGTAPPPPSPSRATLSLLQNNQPFGLLVTGYPSTTAELVALNAVNHHILRFEVPKSLIIAP